MWDSVYTFNPITHSFLHILSQVVKIANSLPALVCDVINERPRLHILTDPSYFFSGIEHLSATPKGKRHEKVWSEKQNPIKTDIIWSSVSQPFYGNTFENIALER